MSHVSDNDLINFASDQLGARKKDKIIAHCRQCDWCANRLIEAAREHAPEPGPFKLTRFQKISIVVMILALAATVAGMIWFFRQLEGSVASLPTVLDNEIAPIPEPADR